MVLATIYGNLERNAVACTGRGGGNFRQRHYHLPALGRSRGIHARQLARAARRAGSRLAETVRFLGLSCLLNSLAERTRVALETNCILAITGVEWSGPGCRPPANLGHCGCGGIHFRIPAGSLYPSLSHYCVSGLDQRR